MQTRSPCSDSASDRSSNLMVRLIANLIFFFHLLFTTICDKLLRCLVNCSQPSTSRGFGNLCRTIARTPTKRAPIVWRSASFLNNHFRFQLSLYFQPMSPASSFLLRWPLTHPDISGVVPQSRARCTERTGAAHRQSQRPLRRRQSSWLSRWWLWSSGDAAALRRTTRR